MNTNNLLYAALGSGVVALLFARWKTQWINKQDPGTARMFVLPTDRHRQANLIYVRRWLAENDGDPGWQDDGVDSDVRILVIEHRMEVIMTLCANIYVLNFGKLLAHGTPAEIQNNRDVTTAYIGEEDEACLL